MPGCSNKIPFLSLNKNISCCSNGNQDQYDENDEEMDEEGNYYQYYYYPNNDNDNDNDNERGWYSQNYYYGRQPYWYQYAYY